MYEQNQIVIEAPAEKRRMTREQAMALAHMILAELHKVNVLIDQAIQRMEDKRAQEEAVISADSEI